MDRDRLGVIVITEARCLVRYHVRRGIACSYVTWCCLAELACIGTSGTRRVAVEFDIRDLPAPGRDAIDDVVSYDDVVAGIRQLVGSEHINLVESLAERIVEFCLEDERVVRAKVIVEKLDVLGDDTTVGVEIERTADI